MTHLSSVLILYLLQVINIIGRRAFLQLYRKVSVRFFPKHILQRGSLETQRSITGHSAFVFEENSGREIT